ncbi:amino acid permease [bacterium]|nr:amino acid permease [bacterium]
MTQVKHTLSRHLGALALIFYGVGDVLGAGIYALVGKIVGVAGNVASLSFVVGAVIAILTGLSYAKLASLYPVSGGASVYIRRAFKGKLFATLVGVLVMATGLASVSTVVNAFAGYGEKLFSLDPLIIKIIILSSISFLCFWGIRESSGVNIILTIMEVLGLVLVIAAGFKLVSFESANAWVMRFTENIDFNPILLGTTLAFYAFIGFEDLSNLAEEAKNPSRDVPRAILVSILVATVIYITVTILLQMVVDENTIASSTTPLLLIFEKSGWTFVISYFSILAMMAISNTGLINLIMVSRLLYGMSEEGLAPKIFSKIHHKRKTPWVGVVIATLAVALLVFTGSLKILAQTTSLLILIVFSLVHLSLFKINLQSAKHIAWLTIPVLGLVGTVGLMFYFDSDVFLRAAGVIFFGLIFRLLNLKQNL